MFNKILFGNRIRELRLAANITQDKLCERLGIKKQTLSGIETGYRGPSMEVAVALAEYYSVSLDYLVGLSDIPKIHNGSSN